MDDQFQIDAVRYAKTAADLAELLRAEAEWMEGRAVVLTKLADRARANDLKELLRAEAARFRGRAVTVRVAVDVATR